MSDGNADAAAQIVPRSRTKQMLRGARFVISIAIIAYIVARADVAEVFRAMALANWGLVGLAFTLQIVGIMIVSVRFRTLLGAADVHPGLRYLFTSTFSSIFFRQFLPSTLGGDALRGYDAWKAGASKSFTVLALFVDRLLGLGVMAVFVLGALTFVQQTGLDLGSARYWGIGGLLVVVCAIFGLFFRPAGLTKRLDRMPVSLPAKLRGVFAKLQEAAKSFVGHHGILARATLLSILLQTNVVIFYWLLAKSLGIPIPFSSFFVIAPIIVFVMMAPISINGIGLREAISVFILGQYGVESEVALALAWLEFGIVLTVGLIGGLIFASRPSKPTILRKAN